MTSRPAESPERLGSDVAFCIRVYGFDVRGVDSYLNPAWVPEYREGFEMGSWWDTDLRDWFDWDDPPWGGWNRFMYEAHRRREQVPA